ncbi:MAG: isoleucine--tRNA ligase [Planctomycetia bacterium]|nr:isoleucine--tRNA ligase [Planctomycetia bacterium]
MFRTQEGSVSFPKMEVEIMKWWQENEIYEKSLKIRENAKSFIFFEGPPTANGMPHPGHCLTRAIKDLFPRYKTMRGYRCERKAGWDTHGLPVEVEVCKELGIHSKEQIEEYGTEPFIKLCQKSVWRYMKQWEELTQRLGFWIHLKDAYVTYHQSYVESVWWALKNFFDRGLLYQGHKIVWWWAQGGTALSSGEVGQGYREVADPSVFVRFPLVNPPDSFRDLDLVVWTTTPWTLPSNQFAAVHPELEYAEVHFPELKNPRNVILAAGLVETVAKKLSGKNPAKYEIIKTFPGQELLGLRYTPPFYGFYNQDGEKTGTLRTGEKQHVAWRVVPADFVTLDAGTGIVHQAPAFGEDDFNVLQQEISRFVEGEGPEMICAVAPDGTFTEVYPQWKGKWVKALDKEIIQALKASELLFHQEQYLHEYPFCWRSPEDPLIQYPRKSWFVKTTQFRQQMLENNQHINWLPEHIKEGRFGNFLASNVDWALSRERFWGTPLPIWVCEKTGYMEAVANYDELLAKPGIRGTEVWEAAKKAEPDLPEDLKVHKPYIDAITYDSPTTERMPDGSIPRMRRVSEVIDCWFDSGAMPFAQWGYPHKEGSSADFASHFPADFISEALDQTRGWFYSQVAISTLLFGNKSDEDRQKTLKDILSTTKEYPHPFKNCIVLGLMLAEWWESPDGKQRFLNEEEAKNACGKKIVHKIGKMSKSLRNYRSPQEIFDTHGADALRWYFYANQVPWNPIIYSEQAIRDSMPEFILRLWNVFGFFTIYANIDGFIPEEFLTGNVGEMKPEDLSRGTYYRPISERSELDRWILSELNRTTASVIENMDRYENYPAASQITAFVDALSNWYVRRSRERFWSADKTAANIEKWDAYWTLYECMITLAKLVAPFTPFLAENLWKTLVHEPFAHRAVQSVHLCDYPVAAPEKIDETLSVRMSLVREIVSQGHAARMGENLKVRQPLQQVDVILTENALPHMSWLMEHSELVCDELNVKKIEYAQRADQFITYSVLPDLKKLGPKLGKQLPSVKKWLTEADGGELLAQMEAQNGQLTFPLPDGTSVILTSEEIQIRFQAKEGYAASQGPNSVVVLTTELTPELIAEGHAREIVRAIQTRRKELNCEYTARVKVMLQTESDELRNAAKQFSSYISGETLADLFTVEELPEFTDTVPVPVKLSSFDAQLYVKLT